MSTTNFALDELRKHGIEKGSLKQITDRLGMSLEGMDDESATIDITPNRPDMLDINGFTRAVSFLLDKERPKENFYSIKNKPILQVNVTKSVKKVQPFIAVAVIKNVNLSGNNLKNLINFTEKFCETYGRKRRRISMGIYNFDSIKGPLTYDASSSGSFIPLGRKEEMSFDRILKDHEKGVAYSSILSKRRAYPFLSDQNGVIALIPIVNSEATRVTETTKNILIDITGTTQSSAEEAMDMFACSFIDIGADLYPCEIIYKTKKVTTPQLKYKKLRLRRASIEKTLGVFLEDNKAITLANRMGHVAAKYGNYIMLFAPPYRLDVFNEQDIIEDIAIAYGYDKIEKIPIFGFSTGTPEYTKERLNKVSMLMVGMGFTEALNPYLTNEDLNFKNMEHDSDDKSIIKVAYAKTESITMMRTHLLPSILQNLGRSMHEKLPQRLFELGEVFHLDIDKGKAIEGRHLAMVSEHSRANYSEIKSVVAQIMKFAGIKNYRLTELRDSTFIDGRAASIMVDSKSIGYFGEISTKVLVNFKLEEPVVAAEINLEKLLDV